MLQFNGFEQILMAVIRSTHHYDDRDSQGRIKMSDAKRFNEAMSAIFGKHYEAQFLETSSLSAEELIAIHCLVKKGKAFRTAVRMVVEDRLPPKGKSKIDRLVWDKALNVFL